MKSRPAVRVCGCHGAAASESKQWDEKIREEEEEEEKMKKNLVLHVFKKCSTCRELTGGRRRVIGLFTTLALSRLS